MPSILIGVRSPVGMRVHEILMIPQTGQA